jgi:hypothetical protein
MQYVIRVLAVRQASMRPFARSCNHSPRMRARCGHKGGESHSKIAHMTNCAKNRLQDEAKNRPDIITPVRLCGVIGYEGLKALLIARKQMAWCSRVRVVGLLLLVDFVCRNAKSNGGISISADLAHDFVSKLRKKDCPTSATEPLLLLCKIGILRRTRAATFAHVKTSAVYRLEDAYRNKQIAFEVLLTPTLAQKRASADVRCERRLNRKCPWREKLLADLDAISFAGSARPIIARGLRTTGGDNLSRLVSAVDGQDHFVKVSERGQISTSIGSCPRDLLPHLLLDSEPIVSCDISNAHWNFLPLILANRLDHVSGEPGREGYVKDGWGEHNRLAALLSGGDFYRAWCVDPQNDGERDEKKTVLNILLNRKNEDCEGNVLYRRSDRSFLSRSESSRTSNAKIIAI